MSTLFEMLHRTAEILTNNKNTEALYDYIMHSMDDDGGFLRTRWVYREEEKLTDGEYSKEPKIFLVSLESPFDFENNTDYYKIETVEGFTEDENGKSIPVTITNRLTKLAMQIFYTDLSNADAFSSSADWSGQVGYPYPIRVDLERGTAEILDRVDTYY